MIKCHCCHIPITRLSVNQLRMDTGCVEGALRARCLTENFRHVLVGRVQRNEAIGSQPSKGRLGMVSRYSSWIVFGALVP
jgi:hypothetical protein